MSAVCSFVLLPEYCFNPQNSYLQITDYESLSIPRGVLILQVLGGQKFCQNFPAFPNLPTHHADSRESCRFKRTMHLCHDVYIHHSNETLLTISEWLATKIIPNICPNFIHCLKLLGVWYPHTLQWLCLCLYLYLYSDGCYYRKSTIKPPPSNKPPSNKPPPKKSILQIGPPRISPRGLIRISTI